MTSKFYVSLFVTALASIPSANAAAQGVGAEGQADGRCMAAMLAMSEKSRGSDKAGFDSGMMFFMGKIVGRSGKSAVSPALGAGAVSVTDANAPGIAERCAAEMEAVSAAM